MKRLRVILLFLLLGAIVNVAVAWGLAAWRVGAEFYDAQYDIFDPLRPDQRDQAYIDRYGRDISSDNAWTVGELRVSGFQRNGYYAIAADLFDPDFTGGGSGSYPEEIAVTRSGWPLLSMRAIEVLEPGENVLSWKYLMSIPVRVEVDIGGPIALKRPLPLGPIWVGFVINTLFYAVILWLLFPGPFALRRFSRYKRGLCLKCAYDLRGADHEACPECGKEIRKANPA